MMIPVPKNGTDGIFKYTGNPTVAVENQPKALLVVSGDNESLTSQSGDFKGYAYDTLGAASVGGIFGAIAISSGGSGKAAGAAYDPTSVPGGSSYSYQPLMDASIQTDGIGSTASAMVYAVDSYVFTSDNVANFLDDGAPFANSLWELGVSASGAVSSVSDLDVEFDLNPMALDELGFPTSYLYSLPGYSPSMTEAEVALLIDQQMDAALASPGVWTIAGGEADLTGFSPFPAGTMYTPEGSEVDYAAGADAYVEDDVPEPGSAAGMLVGLIALGCKPRCEQSR
jgi:hypothetical protein